MISVDKFIQRFVLLFSAYRDMLPWQLTTSLAEIIEKQIAQLDNHYYIDNGIAIHKTAIVEKAAIIKSPVIIGENCFIGSNVYLRGGVYLDNGVKIGTGCEIKTSIVFQHTSIAHFNFIGDSVIGGGVNFEAGAVTANHFNEREDKIISVVCNNAVINTGVVKFGALIGDNTKIGANAVLSPGTILSPYSIVNRLQLINQFADNK